MAQVRAKKIALQTVQNPKEFLEQLKLKAVDVSFIHGVFFFFTLSNNLFLFMSRKTKWHPEIFFIC